MSDKGSNSGQRPEDNDLATYIMWGVIFGPMLGIVLGLLFLNDIGLGLALGLSIGVLGGTLLVMSKNRR